MLTIDDILNIEGRSDFEIAALELFRFQAVNCGPYAEYLSLIGVRADAVVRWEDIPHLPVELFKTRDVYCPETLPQIIFTSSTTGGGLPSRHLMANVDDYRRVFEKIFMSHYGTSQAIFALLPCYMQREGSSLIYMIGRLIEVGGGGFFLDNTEAMLDSMRKHSGTKILFGVSYALWDLAEKHPERLEQTIVMETGGMKGNRPEISKEKLHGILCGAFGVDRIHSEYGMAELTSQAYSCGDGVFTPPKWMRVSTRDMNDPFDTLPDGARGAINITDLANIHSCAFIQTQDVGIVRPDGSFTITGRVERSEIRGCNLLVQ